MSGNGAGNTKSLLLTAREGITAFVELVFALIPDSSAPQRCLHQFVHIAAVAIDAGTEGDVFVNRFGEGIRALEHHADPTPHFDRIDIGGIEILPFVDHPTLEPTAGDQVIHSVEGSQHCAFAATGWSDERCDLASGNFEEDILDRFKGAVADRDVITGDGHLIVGNVCDVARERHWLGS